MTVTALIPVWNRPELTRRCLESLHAQTRPFTRILVIDNGSNPPYAAPPGVEVLRLGENRGFAAAVNAGWRAAATDFVACINNDVRLDPGWLAALLATPAPFAAGRLYRPDGRIDGTFDLISRGGFPWRAGHGRPDGPPWDQPRPLAMPSFTAVLLETALRDRVGLLDEEFVSYLEDVDYGLRLRRAGITGAYLPQATGIHEGSATAGAWSAFSVRQISRNHARLVSKHWGGHHRRQVLLSRLLWRLLALRHGRWASFPAFAATPGPPPPDDDAEIRALQHASGPDTFWRLYFALAGGR